MIAPNIKPTHNKTINLQPQETEGTYKFDGKFVATPRAIDKFGDAVIVAAHTMLRKRAEEEGGLDYLQVFEICGEKLWFIDDVTHVTCLLPSDY